jgi:alpha-glucosidase
MIGKDIGLGLPTMPQAQIPFNESVHALLRRIRALLDGYDGDRMMVGEVFILDPAEVARFYGEDDELHLSFNFVPLYTRWRADRWRSQIEQQERHIAPRGWPTWVLSNHDNVRHADRYGTEARARAAAVLLLTLRGTPFLYAGEELGLLDAVIPPDRVVDPGGRDGCRAPVPWTRADGHGWGRVDGTDGPWLPFPPDASRRSVEAMREDPGSILHLYRAVLAERRRSQALQLGDLTLLDAPDGVLAWERSAADDRRLVAVNFTEETVAFDAGGWSPVLSSVDDAIEPGALRPDEAVIFEPAVSPPS